MFWSYDSDPISFLSLFKSRAAKRHADAVHVRLRAPKLRGDLAIALAVIPHPPNRRGIASAARLTFGRPPTLPCAFARCKPACTRSCFASAARMPMIASRKIPVPSRYCSVNDLNTTPQAVSRCRCVSVSSVPSRENRSKLQKRTQSNSRRDAAVPLKYLRKA